jgi:hypothetical protein
MEPNMKRARAKLGFRNKTMSEKVAICRRFISGVATVPAARRNSVSVTQLQSRLSAAEAKMKALSLLRKQAMALTAECHQIVNELCRATTAGVCRYSANVPTKSELAAAGLDTIQPPRGTVPPPAPENFRSVPTRDEGAVTFRWKRSLRRSVFILEITTDPGAAAGWKHLRTICGTRTVITGLTSGQSCWFRLRALNGARQSPYTQPLRVRVA